MSLATAMSCRAEPSPPQPAAAASSTHATESAGNPHGTASNRLTMTEDHMLCLRIQHKGYRPLLLSLDPCEGVRLAPPTMSDNARQTAAKHTYGTWRRQRGWNPMHMVSASGSHFTDSDGKKWLDFSSQLMCSNLGHDNKAVIDAIKQQAEELPFAAPGYATTARKSLVDELLPILPKGLTKFFFTTSGTEANEAAVKIAPHVHGQAQGHLSLPRATTAPRRPRSR